MLLCNSVTLCSALSQKCSFVSDTTKLLESLSLSPSMCMHSHTNCSDGSSNLRYILIIGAVIAGVAAYIGYKYYIEHKKHI